MEPDKKKFDLEELYKKICNRIEFGDEKSYTKQLTKDLNLLKRKIIEEAGEVITANNREELIWECADLIYFLFVLMADNKVSIEDVEKENEKRNK